MEKTKNTKKRVLITAISMFLCLLLIGVSVWAATSQNATVSNNITIVGSTETRVGVVVSSRAAAAGTTLYAADTTLPSTDYTQNISKTYDVDTDTAAGPDIVFSVANNYTYYVYKIDFTNHSTEQTASYNIAIKTQDETPANYQFNSQVDVYFGSAGSMAEISYDTTNGYVMTESNVLTARGESETTITRYLVVALNTPLADLSNQAQQPFDIIITVS